MHRHIENDNVGGRSELLQRALLGLDGQTKRLRCKPAAAQGWLPTFDSAMCSLQSGPSMMESKVGKAAIQSSNRGPATDQVRSYGI